MSHASVPVRVPESASRPIGRRVVRWSALVALAFALLATACVPDPGTDPTATTTSTTTSTTSTTTTTVVTPPSFGRTFCSIWKERHPVDDAGAPLPAPQPYVYSIGPDTLVHARSVEQRGADCKDPAARIQFFQGEIIGRTIFLPANNSLDGPQIKPAPYSLTLAEGQPQTPSVEIATINIELSFTGIRIYGTLNVTINGAVSVVSFDGTFTDIDNYSVTLDAPSLDLPGFASKPISARGHLERVAGINSLAFDAAVPDLTVGSLSLTDAAVHLAATTTTGVSAEVRGTLAAAGNQVSVSLSANFDATGQLRDVDGRLTVDLSGTQPGGAAIRLHGDIALSGQASSLRATFAGSGSIGADTVSRASGQVDIAPNGVVTIDGLFDLVSGGSTLHLEGHIVFDGSQATPTLSAVAAGSYQGVTDTGEIVRLDGTVTVTNVGGTFQTTIDGSLQVGALRGTARAAVSTSGSTTTLDVTGNVVAGALDARADGRIVVTDGVVTSLSLNGALRRAARVGDIGISGSLALAGDRTGLHATIAGSFSGPGVSVTGGAALTLDATGNVAALQAGVAGSISQDRWSLASFSGNLIADQQGATLTGSGLVSGPGINYGQAAGTLVVTGGVPELRLTGQLSLTSNGTTVFGDFRIEPGVLTLARVGLVYPPILIDPERVWVQMQTNTDGKCVHMTVLDATFLMGLLFGGQQAAASLGCPA